MDAAIGRGIIKPPHGEVEDGLAQVALSGRGVLARVWSAPSAKRASS